MAGPKFHQPAHGRSGLGFGRHSVFLVSSADAESDVRVDDMIPRIASGPPRLNPRPRSEPKRRTPCLRPSMDDPHNPADTPKPNWEQSRGRQRARPVGGCVPARCEFRSGVQARGSDFKRVRASRQGGRFAGSRDGQVEPAARPIWEPCSLLPRPNPSRRHELTGLEVPPLAAAPKEIRFGSRAVWSHTSIRRLGEPTPPGQSGCAWRLCRACTGWGVGGQTRPGRGPDDACGGHRAAARAPLSAQCVVPRRVEPGRGGWPRGGGGGRGVGSKFLT